MSQRRETTRPTARWLALLTSMLVIAYGAFLIAQAHAPGLFTRFGHAPPIIGMQARAFGLVVVLLGCLPLLLLCRTPRQAAVLGSLLGFGLIILIFSIAYAWPEP